MTDQIRRVQFHNLWGRHTAGIRLFGKWSPLLHFLLDIQFYIAHSLGVSLTRTPVHHFSPFHLYHFSSSPSALLFFLIIALLCQYLCICYVAVWLLPILLCVYYTASPSLSLKKEKNAYFTFKPKSIYYHRTPQARQNSDKLVFSWTRSCYEHLFGVVNEVWGQRLCSGNFHASVEVIPETNNGLFQLHLALIMWFIPAFFNQHSLTSCHESHENTRELL